MGLSIVIVNYNTRDLLDGCLRSIFENPPDVNSLQVIVIDNASSDGSSEMVRERYPEVNLIASQSNLGFARGNNAGFRQATQDFILALNPDVIVKPGALDAMVDFLTQYQDAGAVGCRLVNEAGRLLPSGYKELNLFIVLVSLFQLKKLLPAEWLMRSRFSHLMPRSGHFDAHDKVRQVDYLIGACIMLRREVLEQVGGFDERFFMYIEESDLCLRIRQHGWRIYFVPDGEIVHLVGQSAKRFRSVSFKAFYESLLYYYSKHHPGIEVMIVKMVVVLKLSAEWIVNWLFILLSGDGAERRESQAARLRVLVHYIAGTPLALSESHTSTESLKS